MTVVLYNKGQREIIHDEGVLSPDSHAKVSDALAAKLVELFPAELVDAAAAYKELAEEAKADDVDSMKKAELIAYASELGIDTEGLKVEELKAAIKEKQDAAAAASE